MSYANSVQMLRKYSDLIKENSELTASDDFSHTEDYSISSSNNIAFVKWIADKMQQMAWTKEDASPSRTLVLKPRIKQIKFISGGARFWAGAMAGSSAVVMSVEIVDKENGKIIAHPDFYQHANAMGGAWSFGSTDNIMLVRITEIIDAYLKANYASAVGGATGQPE